MIMSIKNEKVIFLSNETVKIYNFKMYIYAMLTKNHYLANRKTTEAAVKPTSVVLIIMHIAR